jgi:hypothetical protein
VPGGTRLDADPTGLDRREKRQHPRPPQTSPHDHLTVAINAVHLEHRLCYVQPDHHNLSHRSPPVHPSQLTLLPGWRAVHGIRSRPASCRTRTRGQMLLRFFFPTEREGYFEIVGGPALVVNPG